MGQRASPPTRTVARVQLVAMLQAMSGLLNLNWPLTVPNAVQSEKLNQYYGASRGKWLGTTSTS